MVSIEKKAFCLYVWHALERVATSVSDKVVNSTWYPEMMYPVKGKLWCLSYDQQNDLW